MRGKRRTRLYALLAVACLASFGVLFLGVSVFGASSGLLGRVIEPVTTSDQYPTSQFATEELQRAAEQEANFLASARQAAAEHAAKEEAADKAKKETTRPAPNAEEPKTAILPDTTMYLTIPKLGLQNIPVLEGSSEAVLSQGVGHLPGTGYPWIPGSNTYIAGHRLGYPGTVSDHVFWGLPSLAVGDQIILEDSLGRKYTYQVSDTLEVTPSDLSVTESTGRDMISLQTCIENYGDYWTPGPDWFVRYIVRANRVS